MRRIVLVSLLLILCLAIAGAKTCTSDNTKMSNAMLNTKTHLDESKDQNIGVDVLESKNTINFEAKKTNVKTWHVDDDKKEYPNAEYANIQDAINAASDGDVILVYKGVYSPFVVDKKLNLTGVDFPEIIANKENNKVEIVVDGVTLNKFITNATIMLNSSNNLVIKNGIVGKTGMMINGKNNRIIENSFIGNKYGILLRSSNNTLILNKILNCNYGIGARETTYNLVDWNTFINNNVSIVMYNSKRNIIMNNTIFHSNVLGLNLIRSSENVISNNIFVNNTGFAIRIFFGSKNIIVHNILENNTISALMNAPGIHIFIIDSTKDIIFDNIIQGIVQNTYGIFAYNASNTAIKHVMIGNNGCGIYLSKCSNVTVDENSIVFNGYGIYINNSSVITLHKNLINIAGIGLTLENSNSCNIENNRISNITHYALKLIESNENFVRNNTIVDNEQGIFISGDKNTLTRNVVGLKNGIGNYILFITSKSNLIYLNDFSSSRVSTMGGNRFYSPDKIKYEYEGKTFTNYLGNYWGVKESLLTLLDHNKDGIIDMEKKVGMDIDKYQLAKSFKKYRILG